MDRAYSLLNVREFKEDGEFFEFSGIASTPTPDRYDDIVEPKGAKFTTPMPLLWQHEHDKPVGNVTFAKASNDGIPFTAKIPLVKEDGELKKRIDEAIQSIKYNLVKAVSIGFSIIDFEWIGNNNGMHIKEWEWLELSLVTIPANSEAIITEIKSIDQRNRGALLDKKPDHNKPLGATRKGRAVKLVK